MDSTVSYLRAQNIIVPMEFPGATNSTSSIASSIYELIIPSMHQSFRHILHYNEQSLSILNNRASSQYKHLIQALSDASSSSSVNISANSKLLEKSYHTSKRMRLQLKTIRKDIDVYYSSVCDMQAELQQVNKAVLNNVELLDDDIMYLERLWHLAEVVTFFNPSTIGFQFIAWLQDDYDDNVKLVAISDFVVKYTSSDSMISSNVMSKTASTTHFEEDVYGCTDMSYEDALIWLCTRGHLSLLWNLFAIYPEINRILSESDYHAGAGDAMMSSIRTFHQLLASHPYASHDMATIDAIGSSMATSLQVWKQQVQAFLASKDPILSKRPYMFIILQILSGNEAVMLESASSSTWMTYLLSSLLYNYAPPLTRRDLMRIADKSFTSYTSKHPVNDKDRMMHRAMVSSLEGNFAAIIKDMYELGLKLGSMSSRLVCLASAAHLTILIASAENAFGISSNQSSFLAELPTHINQASFIEELLLEVAELLDTLHFPVEIVAGYLSLCPKSGHAYLQAIMQHRVIASDDEAIQVAEVLRAAELHADARSVLICRGMYWWKRSMLNARIYGALDSISSIAYGAFAAKAIYIFQLADDDQHRIRNILDLAFVRCAYAVKRAAELFPGLEINPIRPAPPLIPGSSWYAAPGSTAYVMLTTVPHPVYETRKAAFAQSDELIASLQDAYDMLAVLDDKNQLYPEAQGLRGYVTGIKLYLDSSSWQERQSAAQSIAQILLDGSMFDRHWLHLLELMVWFHHSKDVARRSRMEMVTDIDTNDPIPRSLFNKSQAYGFLTALYRLDSSLSFPRYKNGCSDDHIQSLRRTLLTLLSDSILLENEEKGAKYRAVKAAADAKELKKFRHRMRGGLSEEEYKNAMVVLTGGMFPIEEL